MSKFTTQIEGKTMKMLSIIPQIFTLRNQVVEEDRGLLSNGKVSWHISQPKKVSASEMISLSDLEVGERARIVEIDSSSEFAGRLKDLGFVPDTIVQCRQKAPFGDPVEYEVRGSRFCLRHHEARDIRVVRLDHQKEELIK